MSNGRGSSRKKGMREIAEELERQGWVVSKSPGGHWKFCPADKRKPPLFMPQTPSDYRGYLNGLAQLKRAGADVSRLKR